MKNIYLHWFQHAEGHGNFGDELNPYIIDKLSPEGAQIIFTPNAFFYESRKKLAIIVLRKLRSKEYASFKELFNAMEFKLLFQKPIIAIGSVISVHTASNCTVWGSGLISLAHQIHNANFLAVRGKITEKRLKELGYIKKDIVKGDPALLLPLVYEPKNNPKNKIGIIPHYVQYEETLKLYKDKENYIVINVLDRIEKILDDINTCKYTLSSSLHGIIVSHAYQVPSLWVNFSDAKLHGDNCKFEDYFSSVDIEPYDGIKNNELSNIDFNNEKIKKAMLPSYDKIEAIQKNLLKVAPFQLKGKYKI